MTWSRITISARAAMPFSRPTSFERLARNFESFRKPRTGLPILFLCASLNRNEGRHERQRGKVMYPLDEVLLLCLLAVLAGADTFVDIARFGGKKIDLLRRFRPFRDGTPSHDHLGDIFATLDAAHFQRCFVSWVASLTGVPDGVIAVDGKTSRRSYQGKGAKAPIHMVSAVSGAKPRAACIFPLPPTRAGTIRLVHVTARRSAWPASPRVGSARGGAVWRGGRAEAAGGGATRRDRTTEGPQGSPG